MNVCCCGSLAVPMNYASSAPAAPSGSSIAYFVRAFSRVIVEFAVRHDFAGDRGLGIVVAEHGDFDFAPYDALLDEHLHGKSRSQVQRTSKFRTRVNFGHTNRRAERGWLHKHGILEFLLDSFLNFFGNALPIRALHGNPR